MRISIRSSALALAAAAAIAPAAAEAQAGVVRQTGTVSGLPGAAVTLELERKAGGPRSVALEFTRIPIACSDGERIVLPSLAPFGLDVRHRRFRFEDEFGASSQLTGGFERYRGRISRDGRRARGRLRVAADLVDGRRCETGELRWRTARAADARAPR